MNNVNFLISLPDGIFIIGQNHLQYCSAPHFYDLVPFVNPLGWKCKQKKNECNVKE